MSSTAVFYCVLFLTLAAAFGGAAYGSKISFSKIRNRTNDVGIKGIVYYTRTGSVFLTLWMFLWIVSTILSVYYSQTDPKAGLKARKHLSTIYSLAGSAAVCLLFVIQTLLLSISTTSSLIQKVSRFLLFGVSLIFPLGIAHAILDEIMFARGDSGRDLGHLGPIIAASVIRMMLLAIELLTALISLFCVVKYRKFFPLTFYRPLCIINGLSSIRHLFHILPFLLFTVKLGGQVSQTQYRILYILSVIFTGWTNVACLIIAVNLLSGYFEVGSVTTSDLDETSPLLNNNSTQGEAIREDI